MKWLPLLLLVGCSSIDISRAPQTDWPPLKVVEHRVEDWQMRDRCAKYAPPGSFVEACAEVYFAENECHIWLTKDTPEWIREHELLHCQGYDHVGETTLNDAWETYKRGGTNR